MAQILWKQRPSDNWTALKLSSLWLRRTG